MTSENVSYISNFLITVNSSVSVFIYYYKHKYIIQNITMVSVRPHALNMVNKLILS